MSKYTMELRNVCKIITRETVESWFTDYDLSDVLLPNQIETVTTAGLFNKEKLAKRIVDAYFMREIGFETIALFKHYVKINMARIMEIKLPLIYTISLSYDPLVNVDYTETFNRTIGRENTNTGTSNSTTTSNADALTINSDTPQGQINKDEILQGKYASSTSAGNSSSNVNETLNSSTNGSSNDNENYTKHTQGNSGVLSTNQKLIEQYRDNIRSIYGEIIEELNILFMSIY